jgi:hypothetical protein
MPQSCKRYGLLPKWKHLPLYIYADVWESDKLLDCDVVYLAHACSLVLYVLNCWRNHSVFYTFKGIASTSLYDLAYLGWSSINT